MPAYARRQIVDESVLGVYHCMGIAWFDQVGYQLAPDFGVQLSLVHDAPNRVYRLTEGAKGNELK